jgi:tetrahydromethanopterin S-methyltransferase subunit E
VNDTKTELKAIFEGKGVWLSDRTFWTCLCIFSLLLIFFAMTVFANITIIHSGDLTLLLWIYGLAIAAIGLSYRDSRKR